MTREHPHEHDPGTQRIEAFSDGVFAIAITLLIIEIGVPRLQGGESLAHALGDLWPSYGAYVLSFLMIGIYWANHHAFFKLFVRTDHVFLMLNVFFLMCIAFLPFPTAVLGDYLDNADERQAAASLYALGLLLPAFGWLTVWLYACWHGLTDERLHPSFVRSMTVQYLLSNACYATALAVSFASTFAGLAICVAITLLYLLPPRQPRYID